MRLAKSVRIVFGLAVGSGVALVLSSSAFAADDGAGTSAESLTISAMRTVEETGSQGGGSLTETTSAVSTDSSKPERAELSQSGLTVRKDVVEPAEQASISQGDSPMTSTGIPTEASRPTAAEPEALSSDVSASGTAITEKTLGTPELKTSQPVVAEDDGKSTTVTPVEDGVVFRSTVLPIQPKITTARPAVVQDLATAIPSAPEQKQNPTKTPTPTQPSGVFGHLTAELAGTVVPKAFWLPLLDEGRAAAPVMAVLALPVLVAGGIVSTFGAVLRREGFAHAARSDVADSGFNTFFAPPFRLDYVSAFQPTHNPFFMAADMKTVQSIVCNAFRKEETR